MNEEIHFRLLRLLVEQPQSNQRQLARALGLSLGKINYCVRALIEKGWVKVENFRSSQHKLSYAYILTPSGLRARARATADFLRRKQNEYVALEQEIAQLQREAASLGQTDSHAPQGPNTR